MTYTPTNVIQYNEYYPFGLQTSTSWTRTSSKNNFLYNDGSELNSNSGWYETFFRGYDAALGRFHQTDPMASSFASHSPYHYAYNNPISTNDPMGAEPAKVIQEPNMPLDEKGLPMHIGGTGMMSSGQWKDFASDLSAISNYESKKDFLYKALRSKSGGTWSDGKTHYFKSDKEAVEYVQKNLNYIQVAQTVATASNVHYQYDIKFKVRNGNKVAIKSRRKVENPNCPKCDEELTKNLNDVITGVGGATYGTGEFVIASNYEQLVEKLVTKTGFAAADVERAVTGVEGALKKGGKVFFYLGTAVSVGMMTKHIAEKDFKAASKDYVDTVMGVVGTMGPVGFGLSTVYFVVDQTVGWNWLTDNFGISDSKAKELWSNYYSGEKTSKILDR